MWERKSPEESVEVEDERFNARRNPIPPLVVGFLVGVLCFVFGGMKLSTSLFGFIAGFVLAFIGQFITGNVFIFVENTMAVNDTVICNRCRLIKTEDDKKSCACGGEFEVLDNWKWVDK